MKTIVVSQSPGPDEKINYNDNIVIKLTTKTIKVESNKFNKVPSVINLSLRKAINKLITDGFMVEINGSGEVIDQLPKAGSEQVPQSKVILFCKNIF